MNIKQLMARFKAAAVEARWMAEMASAATPDQQHLVPESKESIEADRAVLFQRLSSLGCHVVPFAGRSFLWSILKEVERGGNYP